MKDKSISPMCSCCTRSEIWRILTKRLGNFLERFLLVSHLVFAAWLTPDAKGVMCTGCTRFNVLDLLTLKWSHNGSQKVSRGSSKSSDVWKCQLRSTRYDINVPQNKHSDRGTAYLNSLKAFSTTFSRASFWQQWCVQSPFLLDYLPCWPQLTSR